MALSPEQVNELKDKMCNIEDVEKEIDNSILLFHGSYSWEEAIISGELPVETRDEIAQHYINAGWKYVYHNTSSELGERPGLTSFKFSNDAILHCENNHKYHKVAAKKKTTS
jgi:hypothetical protein